MRSQIDSTVLSGFNFLSSCAKRLKEYNNGVLIGITTAGVVIPEASKTMGAYIPAKFALQGMLSMFKQELSQYRVGVYSLAPGFMAGGMNSAIPKAFVEILKNKSPSKLLTIPEDVAREIVSLASAPFEEHHTILTITLAPEFE
jgi:NAD(P)-dependent dehydrogenase (short-subunit alcohol dehydrogenase family)